MIALDARNTVAFTTGLLAAVNPCGFVLLPTYLLYFLGMENLRPGGTERASLRRALLVSLAVSAGFLAVFAVIGVITKWSTDWFVVKAPWISLAIGLAMVVLGIAMLFGFHLPFTTPKLNAGGRDRTVPSMSPRACSARRAPAVSSASGTPPGRSVQAHPPAAALV